MLISPGMPVLVCLAHPDVKLPAEDPVGCNTAGSNETVNW